MDFLEIQNTIRQQRALVTGLDHAVNNLEEAICHRIEIDKSTYYETFAEPGEKERDIEVADELIESCKRAANNYVRLIADTQFKLKGQEVAI